MPELIIHVSALPSMHVTQHDVTFLADLQRPLFDTACKLTETEHAGCRSRAVGWRFGKHLPAAVPLVIQHLQAGKEGDDELKVCARTSACAAGHALWWLGFKI